MLYDVPFVDTNVAIQCLRNLTFTSASVTALTTFSLLPK